uniref:dTDP-glucose 4,6-dehydratase/UDP-glucuronate decarboxylase n=1 Tax=Candidatus Kentrum sp. DK TaxID=2126562 RepID=A0A450TBL0_9GAMM|nr:MAG: dTDP-glucose 4,6-dehydratase/UDP-glucuronate decarboxylase [Candidatus Kentron sp. DK]
MVFPGMYFHSKKMNSHFVRDATEVLEDLGSKQHNFSGATILLTGAAGFLGAAFTHYFLLLNDRLLHESPCKVIALDSFIRGYPKWLRNLDTRADLCILERDITMAEDLPKTDYVVHAASIASPIYYRQHPIETMDANVKGLRRLLDRAITEPIKSFLFFSSSEIYGDPDPENIPTSEDYRGYVSCTGPRACYDESKRYGETLCVNFWKQHGVPVKIARPFNNYGPGLSLNDGRVLSDFFREILAGRNIVLYSDGKATRTFCYVADALKGYLRLLLSDENGEAFNIGNPQPEISIIDLARLTIEVAGAKTGIRLEISEDADYLTDCPQRRSPCIDKARQRLGYSPAISLEEGLVRCLAYYKDHRNER